MIKEREFQAYVFADYAKTVLNIEMPDIQFCNADDFATKTQMARAIVNKNVIYINKKIDDEKYLCFCIAHECRHLWQFQTGFLDTLLKTRKQSNETTIYQYNIQEKEIDAHAFGVIIAVEFYDMAPDFPALDEKMRKKIFIRAKAIKKTLNFQSTLVLLH